MGLAAGCAIWTSQRSSCRIEKTRELDLREGDKRRQNFSFQGKEGIGGPGFVQVHPITRDLGKSLTLPRQFGDNTQIAYLTG